MEKAKKWLKCAGIRALKTFAQTAVATIGTSAIISEVNWVMVASASVLAALISLLTSVAGLPELKEEKKSEESNVISTHGGKDRRGDYRNARTRHQGVAGAWMRNRKHIVYG